MACWQILCLAAAIGAPLAEVETLKGEKHSGELVAIDAGAALLKSQAAEATIPLAEVLEIRFPASAQPEVSTGPRAALLDGTHLSLKSFSIAGDKARCETPFGGFSLPVARMAHVRFGISTAKLDEAWNALLARDSKNDLLVVRKDDVLDFLAGVTGDVGDKINLLLDGDEVPVAREKVYGIIFHRRSPNVPKSVCQVRLAGGDVLETTRVAWDGSELKVRLAAGPDIVLPAALVAALDFSAGKIRYLSQLEPRDVKYVPFFDIVFEYRRDKSLDGGPLTLAGKTYSRGLAVHSRATLRYRIAGDYSRFQAVAGIDDEVRRLGDVRLVIKGDGKPLFDDEILGTDKPRPIDLDVTGVRDLEIFVDFGKDDSEIADHLDLADAKLLK